MLPTDRPTDHVITATTIDRAWHGCTCSLRWHNSLTTAQLYWQQFREVTIAQPTWFMARSVFDRVGGYDQDYPHCPEDMIFFHRHLALGGSLHSVNKVLLHYRHLSTSTCHSITRTRLMQEKARHFEHQVLQALPSITIWNAGKDGRKMFMSLSAQARNKVVAFCDVDADKIGKPYYDHVNRRAIPVVHFSAAKAPVAIWYVGTLAVVRVVVVRVVDSMDWMQCGNGPI
jgi:hypothetical protein